MVRADRSIVKKDGHFQAKPTLAIPVADLSVAIATLDRPDGLARCLGALLGGTMLPADVIVVDQGSVAGAREVVEAAHERGVVPITYLHQDRQGLSASRNDGIRHARNSVVAFLDDDCVPDADWIAAIDRTIAQAPHVDAVTGSIAPFGPATLNTFVVSPREGQQPVSFKGRAVPWFVGSGGNCAVRREWLERIGLFDERLGAGSVGKAAEDMDLFHRLLRAGACIRYEPRAVVYHERQSLVRRLATRWSYGYGMGAFLGIWLRRRDPYALCLLGRWLLAVGRELGRGIFIERDQLAIQQQMLSLRGTVHGLAQGLIRLR